MTNKLPNIYLFNATCEMAVANGHTSWQPNLLLQKMEEELGALPLFFARPNDALLVKKVPSQKYLEQLEKAGIKPPSFIKINDLNKNTLFLTAPKKCLLPWGWSPAAHKLLDLLKPSCSQEFNSSPVAVWKPFYREIYSKKFALGILNKVLPRLPEGKTIPQEFVPEICTTRQEIEELIARWGRLMVKAPWSSSGRGLQPIKKTPVPPKLWEKLLGIINEQGYAMVEPYLDKVLDMALLFSLYKGKVHYVGISRFFTDENGKYQGNYLNNWPDWIDKEATEFAESMLKNLISCLSTAIEDSILAEYYEGSFGIDTLIFRDRENRLRINPCLEINVRKTMGLLSLHLEKLTVPGKNALFKFHFQKEKNFSIFQKEMLEKFPMQFTENRLDYGFFPLTPASENTLFGAYLLSDDTIL